MNDQLRGDWTSASNAQADALCPGRHIAQKGISDQTSEDALFGTKVHEALAGRIDLNVLTDEQRDVYESCVKIEERLIMQTFPDVNPALARPVREKRLWIKWSNELQHSGQLDYLCMKGDSALIVEYKALPGEVPSSPKNAQLRDQAVLVMANRPTTKQVYVAVCQPLVTHSPEICLYKEDDLKLAERQLFFRVTASHNPESPRVAGEIQCKYCRAKTKCPQYQIWAGAVIPQPDGILGVPMESWTPDQCAAVASNLSRAQKWLEQAKEHLKARLRLNPEAIPGWKLGDGQKRSEVSDPQQLLDRFIRAGGSLNQFMECVGIGKGEFKRVFKEATKLKGKSLDKRLDEVYSGLVTETTTEPSLEKDKE